MKLSMMKDWRQAGMHSFRRLSVLLLLFLTGLGAQAQTFSYTSQQPLPVFGGGGAAYGNGVYVDVSGGGFIYRSLDGFHWSVATNSAFLNTNYSSVCFGQGLFVACAANGAIVTSSNGLNWSLQNSGTTRYPIECVYLNGRYFVTCNGGIILSSTNATNWVSQTVAGSTYEFNNLSYGDGKYVMAATDAAANYSYYIYTSTTGTGGWTPSAISGESGQNYNFIGYLNNKFYTFLSNAHIYTSPDGSTWTQFTSAPIASTGYQMFGGIYTNGTYYFFGYDSQTYGSIFTSTDGSIFSEAPKGFTDQIVNLVYGNGVFVACNGESIHSSTNAANWVSVNGSYFGVAYNGTNYVAVGSAGNSSDGYIAVSSDYVNWTNVTPGWTPNYSGVTYGNGEFAAVGYAMGGFTNSVVAMSGDGVHWSLHTNTDNPDSFYAVATDGEGTFVAVGDNGDTLRSTDNGTTWTLGSSGAGNPLYAISYVNSQFVAVGYGGSVAYSTNGSSWNSANYSDNGSDLTGITYGNGTYVAVGYDSNYNSLYLTRTSLASGSWAVPGSPPPVVQPGSGQLTVNYGNGVFLSYYDDANYNGYLFTSTNGQTWTQQVELANTNVYSPDIYGGIFANGAFRLAGLYDYTGTATAILPQPPVITSAATADATYGSAFSYTITGSNSPTTYGASGLPTGLSVSTSSGVISGTPTESGAYTATIGATNGAGSGTASLAITVAQANVTISGLTVDNKVYNGTSTATLNFAGATLNGVVNGDSISLDDAGSTANFSTANVGNNLAVTISGLTLAGAKATNYTLTQPTGLTADITRAPATVTLNRSVQLYSDAGIGVTNGVNPTGLPVNVTYNGSSLFPTNVGAYTVIATVNNPNYSGSATNTLYIAPAPNFVSVTTNAANQVVFTWTALNQVDYHVYSTPSLTPPVNWTDLFGAVPATNNLMTGADAIDLLPPTNRFYRVELILQ